MPEIAQPRRPVDGGADVIAFIAQLHLTGMHADAQSDRRQRGTLEFQRTGHRVTGPRECNDEAVALTLLDRPHPAMCGDQSDVHHPAARTQLSSRRVGFPTAAWSPRRRPTATSRCRR